MQDDSTRRFPTLAVRATALWIAIGAIFKLYWGTPNELPPVVREFALFGWDPSAGTILRLAVGIELVLVFTALLRPRWAWPWLCAQLAIFLGVLTTTVLQAQSAALEPTTFSAAMFDPEVSCGCFGSSVTIPPGYMMIVDGLFLILLLASRPWRGRLGHFGPEWLPTGFVCLALILPWTRSTGGKPVKPAPSDTGTPAITDGDPPVEVNDPSPSDPPVVPVDPPAPAEDWWAGLTVDQLDYVELPLDEWNDTLIYDLAFRPYPDEPDAQYAPFWAVTGLEEELAMLPLDATFVLYRDSCDHCAAHIQELATGDTGARPLVFVRIPEDGEAQDVVQLDQLYPESTPHASRLELPSGVTYVFTTPGDFQVDGGMVTEAREGIGR